MTKLRVKLPGAHPRLGRKLAKGRIGPRPDVVGSVVRSVIGAAKLLVTIGPDGFEKAGGPDSRR